MGCRITETRIPLFLQKSAIFRVITDFPHPVLTAQTEMTGTLLSIIVSSGPRRTKLAPFRKDQRGLIHQFFMGNITVGENDLLGLVFLESDWEVHPPDRWGFPRDSSDRRVLEDRFGSRCRESASAVKATTS